MKTLSIAYRSISCLLLLLLGSSSLCNAQTSDSLIVSLIDGKQLKIALDEIDVITFETIESSVDPIHPSPQELSVYPNPSTNDVSVSFTVESQQSVKIEIVREDGLLIRTLEQSCTAGETTIKWDGLLDGGSPAPASTYLFRAVMREKTLTGKLSLRR